MMAKKLLFVADIESGSGHLLRSISLQSAMGGDILLFQSGGQSGRNPLLHCREIVENPIFIVDEGQSFSYDSIIFDCRRLQRKQLDRFSTSLSIGIDLGGSARDYLGYIIDTLPNACSEANLCDYGFLEGEEAERQWPEEIRSILIIFGGSDNGARAESITDALRRDGVQHVDSRVGILSKVLNAESSGNIDIEQILQSGRDLRRDLGSYDLVITHFGRFAYEALWNRCPVLLLNPSRYHDFLAEQSSLPYIAAAWKQRSEKLATAIIRELSSPDILKKLCSAARPKVRRNLPAHLQQCIEHHQGTSMRRGFQDRVIMRLPDRSYFHSLHWNIRYMEHFSSNKITYSRDYFFQEYKQQYGKTYLEDGEQIRALARKRIERIAKLKPPARTLLDIGCAYGFFLQEAAESGFHVEGLDISSEAVDYVTSSLGFPARHYDIQKGDLVGACNSRTFGVVSMYYVLEHCVDVLGILRSVRSILMPGGILALALPNGSGISARTNLRMFLENSPVDHYGIFSHSPISSIFCLAGFRPCYARSTGHHTERFPGALSHLGKPLLSWISRRASLGDTFEVYFRRIEDGKGGRM